MDRLNRKSILNCFRIGKLWYGVVILTLQIYVHYDMLAAYIDFKKQMNSERYGLEWNTTPMTISLIIVMFSISLVPFFIYSCLVKTGNLVNDDVQLGHPNMWKLLPENSYFLRALTENQFKPRACEKLQYALMPSSQSLHFVSSFLLLIPHAFLQIERFRNSALNEEYLWTSDLHSLFNINNFQNTGAILIGQKSEKLNFPIYTVNFIVASIFLSLQTSSVFWRVSKSFTAVIALFDSIISLSFLILQSVLRVAIRYYNQSEGKSIEPIYNFYFIFACLLVSFIVFIICRILLYQFGLCRFIINQRSYYKYLEDSKMPSISQGLLQNSKEFRERLRYQMKSLWLNILAGLLWVIEAGLLITVGCYLVSTFWLSNNSFCLVGFVAAIAILLAWLIIWLLLSIKKNWIFQVTVNPTLTQNVNIYNCPADLLSNSDPIYTCFQENRALSRCSLKSDKNSFMLHNSPNGDVLFNNDQYQSFPSNRELAAYSHMKSQEFMPHQAAIHHKMFASNNILNGGTLNSNSRCNSLFYRNSGLQASQDLIQYSTQRAASTRTPNTNSSNYPNAIISEDSDYQSGIKNSNPNLLIDNSINSMPSFRRPMQMANPNNNNNNNNNNNINNYNIDSNSYSHVKHPGLMKEYDDNNTDISTDFSDQNTNSSSRESSNLSMLRTGRRYPLQMPMFKTKQSNHDDSSLNNGTDGECEADTYQMHLPNNYNFNPNIVELQNELMYNNPSNRTSNHNINNINNHHNSNPMYLHQTGV